jgi:sporulation protein YlmC with PRC-barrel domain
MADVLAENLSGKSVMSKEGDKLGMLYNITMDIDSGTLGDLVVEPDQEAPETSFSRDEEGRYRIPASRVHAVRDYISVER